MEGTRQPTRKVGIPGGELARWLVGFSIAVACAGFMGCGSSDESESPAGSGEAAITESSDSTEIESAKSALEAEGFQVATEGAGQLDVGGLDVTGGAVLDDASISIVFYDDRAKALTERDSIAKVFTGRLAGRGTTEMSSDELVLFYIAREGQLSDAQIAEFQRVKASVEAAR